MKCNAVGCVDGQITLFTGSVPCDECGGTGTIGGSVELKLDFSKTSPHLTRAVREHMRKLAENLSADSSICYALQFPEAALITEYQGRYAVASLKECKELFAKYGYEGGVIDRIDWSNAHYKIQGRLFHSDYTGKFALSGPCEDSETATSVANTLIQATKEVALESGLKPISDT